SVAAGGEHVARLGLDEPEPDPSEKSAAGETGHADRPGNGRSQRVEPTVRGLPVPAHAEGASYMSPRMKARMHELGLHAADLAGLPGSGAAGRGPVHDFETFIENVVAD